MSDKQLTGTITLPGVDPDVFELTGEYRQANLGEYYCDWFSQPRLHEEGSDCTHSMFPILRRKPRKVRVTPTQADLDAATEPIPCWVKDEGDITWSYKRLVGIKRFVKAKSYITAEGYDWDFCEIEKEEA